MKDQNPDKWMTVPFAIAYEPYAYITREGQSDFRDFVNNTIIWSIKNGKFYELYEKWMGPKGLVPIPMSTLESCSVMMATPRLPTPAPP